MQDEILDWQTWQAVSQIHLDYWAVLDGILSISIDRIFTSDGELALGGLTVKGISEIEQFLHKRRSAQPDRVTRHVASNYCPKVEATGEISCRSLVTVYAGTGTLPFSTIMPTSVNDVTDRFINKANGWRLARREIQTLFVGPGAPAFLSPKPVPLNGDREKPP